ALSPQYMSRATDLFCRNLDAFLKGEPMPTIVDPQRGY
ncbi:MAG TPA: D-2-hydroxyacid dehydrogenase, partial [Firmicutes bacterium]|nr:D-2-hydroxyacid dehydrogenase [Bacillota bacterium]